MSVCVFHDKQLVFIIFTLVNIFPLMNLSSFLPRSQTGLALQHAVSRGFSNPGHEFGAALHEGAWRADSRPSGEQQHVLGQFEHRPGRLRVVRRRRALLGHRS